VANTQNPLTRFLAWSARHGSILLAVWIFGGLLFPPLAHALVWFVTPNVVLLVTMVLLRVDVSAAVFHLRRPGRLVAIVAFYLIAAPMLMAGLLHVIPMDDGVRAAVIISSTGAAGTSGAAFARLVGLDPELTLIATLAGIFIVPFTGPPLSFWLAGFDLHIGLGAFMLRLALAVGVPLLLSLVIRRVVGKERLEPLGPALDGALVWLVVLYGFAVMDGMQAKLLADPWWMAQAIFAAFAANYGLNLLTTLVFLGIGLRSAASAGLMSGNRNMALYLAVLPSGADHRIALFFGLAQIPLFLSPFLLRPVYRRILRL
jgi:bile acid:Na+ symporter, BASS family